MKVLSSLRKRTKAGISVWNFCYCNETERFFAVGGDDLSLIKAVDRKHLVHIYNNFKRYGFREKLAPKKQYISDPWASELPIELQQQLEALA